MLNKYKTFNKDNITKLNKELKSNFNITDSLDYDFYDLKLRNEEPKQKIQELDVISNSLSYPSFNKTYKIRPKKNDVI
mgnify:CR=1 FL=1